MYKLKPGWTKEKVLEQIKKHNNGTRAIDSGSVCVYDDHHGNRCAIGCFLPDDHRALRFIGGVSALLTNFPEFWPLMPFAARDELEHLQSAHDSCPGDTHEYLSLWLDAHVEES